MPLYLRDDQDEDIICVFYDVFDFIDSARQKGGKVFVHCRRGISRSPGLCIAYLMCSEQKNWDDMWSFLKAKRQIAQPNLGFAAQLNLWYERFSGTMQEKCLYRVTRHSKGDPDRIVAKWVYPLEPSALDNRFIFILVSYADNVIYVWIGSNVQHRETFLSIASKQVERLQKWEHAPSKVEQIEEKDTPKIFWKILDGQPPTPQNSSLDSEYDLDCSVPSTSPNSPTSVPSLSSSVGDLEITDNPSTHSTKKGPPLGLLMGLQSPKNQNNFAAGLTSPKRADFTATLTSPRAESKKR